MITLPPELEKLIYEKVQSGLYDSPAEVVRAGLRLLKQQEQLQQIQLDELRQETTLGKKAIDEGRYKIYNSGAELIEDVFREGMGELKEQQQND